MGISFCSRGENCLRWFKMWHNCWDGIIIIIIIIITIIIIIVIINIVITIIIIIIIINVGLRSRACSWGGLPRVRLREGRRSPGSCSCCRHNDDQYHQWWPISSSKLSSLFSSSMLWRPSSSWELHLQVLPDIRIVGDLPVCGFSLTSTSGNAPFEVKNDAGYGTIAMLVTDGNGDYFDWWNVAEFLWVDIWIWQKSIWSCRRRKILPQNVVEFGQIYLLIFAQTVKWQYPKMLIVAQIKNW